jgi:hypothetical protein
MTTVPLELRDMVSHHLTIDLEDGLHPIAQEDGELKFFTKSNKKAVKLPRFMGTDFVTEFVVHIYRTRTFVFAETYNHTTNAAAPARVLSKMVQKDPYNLGLQPHQPISRVMII